MQTSFQTLKLQDQLISGLKKQNIVSPTPIQALTYPAFLEGKDLMVESHTGSGKTLAFLLPLFEKINKDLKANQAIILAPTHELAHQIHEQIKLLAKNSDLPITSILLMGEVSIEKQIIKLREKPQIIVGSPGRILDLMMKKKISVSTLETVLLDEADNLLETSQSATVKKLLYHIGNNVQVAMFSASMSASVKQLAAPFLKAPVFLHTSEKTALNPNIEHFYIKTELREKFDTLKKLLLATNTPRALVFVSQHTDTRLLVEKLNYHGFTVATISGKLSKEERKNALAQFKAGKVRILLSSDLSARGLDVAHIMHIFHYDLPLTPQDYLHRSGRSARNGQKGTSISILTPKDLGIIGLLERTFKIKPNEIALIKGRVKNLVTNEFLETAQVPTVLEETSVSKKRNKYPKGFNSNNPNKKTRGKENSSNSSATKETKAQKQTSKTSAHDAKRLPKKMIQTKKASIEPDFLTSGSLADALRLIEEAGLTKNNE